MSSKLKFTGHEKHEGVVLVDWYGPDDKEV